MSVFCLSILLIVYNTFDIFIVAKGDRVLHGIVLYKAVAVQVPAACNVAGDDVPIGKTPNYM